MIQKIKPDLMVSVVGQDNIGKVCNSSNHQGIALYCESLNINKKLSVEDLEDHKRIILMDAVTDVNNIGAIMRSMVAIGFTALIVTRKNMPDIEKCALKSSCGAIEHLSIFQVASLLQAVTFLKKLPLNFYCIGLDHRGKMIDEVIKRDELSNMRIAGIVGSEDEGISAKIIEECDIVVSLNTNPEFPVLNASVASGIFMYTLL